MSLLSGLPLMICICSPSHPRHPEPKLRSHIHHLPLYPGPSLLSEHFSAFTGQQAYQPINSANNLLGIRKWYPHLREVTFPKLPRFLTFCRPFQNRAAPTHLSLFPLTTITLECMDTYTNRGAHIHTHTQ